MLEKLKPEVNPYTGRTRLRCPTCDKVAFSTREGAQVAVDGIWKDRKFAMEAYEGGACGWWHLATKRGEGR